MIRHQIRLRRLQQEMVVIGHQNVGMHPPARPPAHLPERFQKAPTIRLIPEYRLPAISAIQHMIHCTFKLNARFAGHDRHLDPLSRPLPRARFQQRPHLPPSPREGFDVERRVWWVSGAALEAGILPRAPHAQAGTLELGHEEKTTRS